MSISIGFRNDVFRFLFGDVVVVSERHAFPVRRTWLFRLAREFQVLAGTLTDDSAFVLHRKISALPPPKTPLERLLLRGLVSEFWERFTASHHAHRVNRRDVVRDAQRYLESHYAEHVTIGVLSHSVGCSRAHLTRAFRSTLERSVHDYLTEVRVQHAIEALRDSNDKVEAVANMVGYRSKKDLYRVIRTSTGQTPNAIRASRDRIRRRP